MLKAGLGTSLPFHGLRHHGQPLRQRGPATPRRQERRRAAKVAAGHFPLPTVIVSDAGQSSDTLAAEAGVYFKESEVNTADQEQVVCRRCQC